MEITADCALILKWESSRPISIMIHGLTTVAVLHFLSSLLLCCMKHWFIIFQNKSLLILYAFGKYQVLTTLSFCCPGSAEPGISQAHNEGSLVVVVKYPVDILLWCLEWPQQVTYCSLMSTEHERTESTTVVTTRSTQLCLCLSKLWKHPSLEYPSPPWLTCYSAALPLKKWAFSKYRLKLWSFSLCFFHSIPEKKNCYVWIVPVLSL